MMYAAVYVIIVKAMGLHRKIKRYGGRQLAQIFAAVFFALAVFACAPAYAQVEGVVFITARDLKARISRGERIAILDVRSRGAYENSDIEIKDAIRIPPDELPARALELPMGAGIATFCT